MENVILTRQQLFDLVWSQSFLTISKRYVISDAGLYKICVKLDVPVPRGGHWTKRLADRPPLGKLPPSLSSEQAVTLVIRTKSPEGVSGTMQLNNLREMMERDPKLNLLVPHQLKAPHKLIEEAMRLLTEKPVSDGQLKGVVMSDGNTLDVCVSPTNLFRALLFMDTMIKALQARGHNVVIKKKHTYALLDGHEIKISFREKFKEMIVPETTWTNTECHANGIVFFRIEHFGRREWRDGEQTIEEQLSAILAQMEIDSKLFDTREAAEKALNEKNESKFRIQQEESIRRVRELAKVNALMQDAARWRQANEIREYVKAKEQKAVAMGGVSEELQTSLDWARAKADWLDPLIEKEDELLKEVDRETVAFKR
ncbi:MAG TPA: hypothetical protein VNS58_08940 [Puia sp.]|nr:hypothetical protein [Puia sp.]